MLDVIDYKTIYANGNIPTFSKASKAAFFQLMNRFDGRAPWAGHHVLEFARMFAGFKDHSCTSHQCLGSQPN